MFVLTLEKHKDDKNRVVHYTPVNSITSKAIDQVHSLHGNDMSKTYASVIKEEMELVVHDLSAVLNYTPRCKCDELHDDVRLIFNMACGIVDSLRKELEDDQG